MKSKKIFLCYSNGIAKQKDENKITYDDINECEYFMIPINEIDSCFTLIKPSKYLKFTNGLVTYQLCAIYNDEDRGNIRYDPVLYRIKTEVTSICDLIGLLNSIDKITVSNYITMEDISDYLFMTGVMSMTVTLYNNNSIIYNEEYTLKGVMTNGFDPYKVTKIFKKIYDGTICGSLSSNNKYFMIEQDGNHITWNITKIYETIGLIGVPLMSSNTLVFCTLNQIDKLVEFNSLEINTFVYYEQNKFIADVSESIVNCETCTAIENKIYDASDLYSDTRRTFSSSYNKPWAKLLEIIAHSFFSLNLIHSIYNYEYPHLPFDNIDDNGNDIPYDELYDFDVVIMMKIWNSSKKSISGKEFSINKYSLMKLDDILEKL